MESTSRRSPDLLDAEHSYRFRQSRTMYQCELARRVWKTVSAFGSPFPSKSVDEPFMWGSIPLRNFTNPKTLRWTLGASDMMFNVSHHARSLSRDSSPILT